MPKKKSSGNFYQHYQPKNLATRPLLWMLLALFGLLILAKLLSIVLDLNQPVGISPTGGAPFSWDGKSSVNLLLVSLASEVETAQSVVNFDPKTQKITILEISPQTYSELPRGFGYWKIGSVYKLGQEENPAIGSKLLAQSVAKLISLPIDGVIILKNHQPVSTSDFITNLHKNRLLMISFLANLSSDLTPIQIGKIFWQLSEVRADKTLSLNFLQSNVTESKLLPDSTRVLGVNNVKLDLFIRKNLADSNFLEEGKSIAIFNATTHPGLTVQIARVITNLGGNVIVASSTDNLEAKSKVNFGEDSLTAQRLSQIYAPSCLPKGCQVTDPKIKQSRAQINLILGEDYYQLWYQR